MFKTKEEIIVIQAETKDPIPTRAVFWSHDKGTAKMLFKLRKDGTSQSLAEGTIVPVLLKFNSETAEDGIGRHIYHAVIEDAVNGIVSIVLEDNILGYQGRVEGSIYIELPDSRSLDTAGRFTFDIKRSPIDENVPELEDYYWQGFGEIMNQYHQTIAEIETESERLLNELQARILTLEEKLDDVELRARFKTAYSWSVDGTDRFTKVYPRENLLEETTSTVTVTGNANTNQTMTSTNYKLSKIPFNQLWSNMVVGDKFTFSADVTISGTGFAGNFKPQTAPDVWLGIGESYIITKAESFRIVSTGIVTQSLLDSNLVSMIQIKYNNVPTTVNITFSKPKLERGSVATPYTPAPSEDPINAYPTYKGISIVDSDNPADYSWQAEDNTIAKKATLDSHTENISNPHKVTKTQVGLENVDNYSTATQAEAEAGTDNAKTMTPLRTSQQIDKKSVTLASNQTVGGIKDFKDGLLSNGTSVVTDQFVFKTVATANTTDFTPESSVTFQRWGRMVVANVSITNKDANFAGWKTLMQFPAGYAPSQRAGWGGALTNMSNRLPALSVYANAAGIQVMPTATDLAKEQSCSGSVAYFTKDAWPS